MSGDRAQTSEQKQAIVHRLLAVWEQYPAMRLGQLIENVTRGRDIFYDEDYPLIREFEKFASREPG